MAISVGRLLGALALISAGLTIPSCSPKATKIGDAAGARATQSNDKAVDEAGRAYIAMLVDVSPEDATTIGIHTRDSELDDYDLPSHEAATKRMEVMVKDLHQRFDSAELGPVARSDVALMETSLMVAVRTRRAMKPLERQPEVYSHPMSAIFLMMARDYAPLAERAQHVIERTERIPKLVAGARKNLGRPPRVWTQVGMDMAASAKAFFEEQREPLRAALPAQKARADAALDAAEHAYADLFVFLRDEVLPRSDGAFAAGPELFGALLRDWHFLDESPDELFALGERVFTRTETQMNEVARRIDPAAKGWSEVTTKLKSRHPERDDLLSAYRREVERARKFLVAKDAVPFPEGDDVQVIDTPPFLRSTTTASYDMPPPFDPVTRGFFFVTPVDRSLSPALQEAMLRENDNGDLVDTSVHEVYPGHHLQLSFARRHPSPVRKIGGRAVLEEGWALYSEELMAELGYYSDEERLMQLSWTLVRAARVMIDVGLHTRGMSFDDAVKLLTDRVHLEVPLATSEVKRYTAAPTQPLSYLVGRERILALRERVKARDGAAFSLKSFHQAVLDSGGLPPDLLARELFPVASH